MDKYNDTQLRLVLIAVENLKVDALSRRDACSNRSGVADELQMIDDVISDVRKKLRERNAAWAATQGRLFRYTELNGASNE